MDPIITQTPSRALTQPRDRVIRTPKCGGRGQLTASSATLYTAPSKTTPTGSTQGALLKSIILCNTDTSARTVTIYVVESGGSAADNRAILKDLTIAAKTTHTEFFPDDCCPLDSGETVRGLADVTLKVTYRISVVEIT
jgi:hypothetical protein